MGKTASSAQFLCDLSFLEGFLQLYRTVRGKDLRKGGGENVPEGNGTLRIQAAGDNGSVRKDTHLVAKSVAGMIFSKVFGFKIGPIEFLSPFKEDSFSHSEA